MTWTPPRTWYAGETVTAAMMNGIRDALNLLKTSIDDDGAIDDATINAALVAAHATIDVQELNVGNIGTGEDILATKTLLGGTLIAGRALRIRAFGFFAANATAKQVRMRIGGASGTNTAISSDLTSYNGIGWSIETLVIRGASNTRAIGSFIAQVAAAGELLVTYTTPAENFDNDQDIVVTGQATNNGDILCHGMTVEVLRVAP